jgi:hypothetical protein
MLCHTDPGISQNSSHNTTGTLNRKMSDAAFDFEVPAHLTVAPHVIIGCCDFAGAGSRACLAMTSEHLKFGKLTCSIDVSAAHGSHAPFGKHVESSFDEAFSIATLYSNEKPIVSLIAINVQFENSQTLPLAHSLVRFLLARQVSQCDIIFATKHNVAPSGWSVAWLNSDQQRIQSRLASLGLEVGLLNSAFPVEDSFCAALMNFLSISEIQTAILFTRGFRLRTGSDNGTSDVVKRCCDVISKLSNGLLAFDSSSFASQSNVAVKEIDDNVDRLMYK